MTPKISVILPVYNAQSYLPESIESILNQSFEDFELIMINDGSTDDSLSIMESYKDQRIRIINQTNAGLPISLNRAIAITKGEYLARQDADDISLPARLAKQVSYLDAHPQCALLGTWAQILVENIPTDRSLSHPHLNGDIQLKLLFFNCFVHSSVMIRKSALETTGLYPEEKEKFPPEDYDLWLRIAKHWEVANLPEVLLQYRELPNSISRSKLNMMQERARLMSLLAIKEILPEPDKNDDIAKLVLAMTNEPFAAPQSHKSIHSNMLEHLRDAQLHRFPSDQNEIAKSYEDCQKLLNHAYQKLAAQQLARYLPINIIPLLKRIKKWLR
jgi:glycosyltransferase involved in cell wall biosynthesis